MIEKVKSISEQGVKYYLVSEYYFMATGKKRAITSLIDKIPKSQLIIYEKRGCKSGVYSTYEGIKEMVNKLPRFPISEREKIGVYSYSCSEIEFEYVICSFLKYFKIEVERQFHYESYSLDFYLPKYNLAIEFNEIHHRASVDEKRHLDIKKKHRLIVCNSSESIGVHIAKISEYIFNLRIE